MLCFLETPVLRFTLLPYTDVIRRREIRDFILCHVLLKTVLFHYEILKTNLLSKIQLNSLNINMWLFLLNVFEENHFYEIKKRNI